MTAKIVCVAQPIYADPNSWPSLPCAAGAAEAFADLIAAHGFELSKRELLQGGNKRSIEDALHDWFLVAPDKAVLILYWTGHGHSEGGKHYLICRNSPATGVTSYDAIDPGQLGEFVTKSKAEKILIILDTCHSGAGANAFMAVLQEQLATRLSLPGEQAYSVITSAHPLQKAEEAVFSNALSKALFERALPVDQRGWSDNDEKLSADDLALAAKRLMPDGGSEVRCTSDGIGQKFIPNPLWRGALQDRNVEEHQRFLRWLDGLEHFEFSARGVEGGAQGWFFSGRRHLLAGLIDWLDSDGSGLRIVTGPPGAGKSAVLGRLATLSDPNLRENAITAGAVEDGDPAPHEGCFDAVVHVKGKTLEDCVRIVAKDLAIALSDGLTADSSSLVEEIGKLPQNVTVMFDALDEAADGQGARIAAELIAPLGQLPGVKILVGSRRSLDGAPVPDNEERHGRLLKAFPGATIDDLADEADAQQDIAAYVRRRLKASARHKDSDPRIIAEAAQRVAERAGAVFLYARIVSRTLEERADLFGPLPVSALVAFEQDLATRFPNDEQRANDLLAALAWGQGRGLTRKVWPRVANAVAQREQSYGEDDVSWALSRAGWHIIDAGEDGQAVYRLSHQALADHYLNNFDDKARIEGRIVAALTEGISGAAWFKCDNYIWRYLSSHAAKANRLAALIRDPGYLAVAEPARLLEALRQVTSEEDQRYVRIYERVADRLIGESPIDRLPLIHMTAQFEDPELAPTLEPPIGTLWRCRWARMRPATPHRVIGRHASGINSIVLGEIDGAPVIVAASDDKIVRVWNARSGALIGRPLAGQAGAITSISLGKIGGAPIVISGRKDKSIRLTDAHSGMQFGAPLLGNVAWVSFLAAGEIGGSPVIISGSSNGSVRIWNARSGQLIGQPLQAGHDWVSCGVLGEIENAPVLIVGSMDRVIYRFDLSGGTPTVMQIHGHTGEVTAVGLGMIDDLPVIISGSADCTARLWDARTGKQIGRPFKGHENQVTSIAFGQLCGEPVVVSGSWDETIRLRYARSGEPVGQPREGHTGSVACVAIGMIDGEQVLISGSVDGTIRLWDTQSSEPVGREHEGHMGVVASVALGRIDDVPVVVSGSDDKTVCIWNALDGALICHPIQGHTDKIVSIAIEQMDDAPIIISGSHDKTIRLWKASEFKPVGCMVIELSEEVRCVAYASIRGKAVILGGGSGDPTIRQWDAHSGALMGEPVKSPYSTNCMAMADIGGAPVIITGAVNGIIQIWDACKGVPIGTPLDGHTREVTAIDFREIKGMPIIASSSSDNTICLWGPPADQRLNENKGFWPNFLDFFCDRTYCNQFTAQKIEAHTRAVTSVALAELAESPVVVSGSLDGTVKVWNAISLTRIATIGTDGVIIDIAVDDEGRIAIGSDRGVALFEIIVAP